MTRYSDITLLSLKQDLPGIWWAALERTNQSKEHHEEGNVLKHTLAVHKAIDLVYQEFGLSEHLLPMLRLAALFHDVGKPYCKQWNEKKERWTFGRHDHIGAIITNNYLFDKGFPYYLRTPVAELVRNHMLWFNYHNSRHQNHLLGRTSYRANLAVLFTLCLADQYGRIADDTERAIEHIYAMADHALKLNCSHQPMPFDTDSQKLLYMKKQWKRFTDPNNYKPEFPVFIMSGLPASGKTTFANELDCPIVSMDRIKQEMGLPPIGPESKTAEKEARKQMFEYARKRVPFIWDATCLTRKSRHRIISSLIDYKAETYIIYCESKDMYKRDWDRDHSIGNRVIDDMRTFWTLPTKDEAHHVIYIDDNTPKDRRETFKLLTGLK